MKILFIIDSLIAGGKERRLLEVLKGLQTEKSLKFELAMLSDRVFYNDLKDLNIVVHRLVRKIKKDPRVIFDLYKICKDFQPDIIHSWESMCSVYAAPLAKLLGLKFINGMISSAPTTLKAFGKGWIRSKLTFPLSDLVISNSFAGLATYKAPANKSYCIHNGFDFSRIQDLEDPAAVRERFNLNGTNIVGMVARFSPKKDYRTYLRAAMQILRWRNDVHFLAVGDGPTLERCKQLVTPEFQDRIKFLGRQENIESVINIFDIGVMLTDPNVHGEGISNSILEYMALKKPVVATGGGGTAEIVVRDKTGFLIDPFNFEELAEKIEILLNDEAGAKMMGKAGRQRVRDEFSLKKMTDRYLNLYQLSNPL